MDELNSCSKCKMIIEIEYLTIIKFIIKTIEVKKTLMKDRREKSIVISIYFVI